MLYFLSLISLILGASYLFAAFYVPSNSGNTFVGFFFLSIALVLFLVGRRQAGKKKDQSDETDTQAGRAAFSLSPTASPASGSITFNVAGTTFDNDDGTSRQEILGHMKFGDAPWAEDPDDLIATIEEDDYNGELAFAVFINGYQIGYVPRNLIKKVEKARENISTCYVSDVEIIGGGRTEDGQRLSYGCSITLEY